MRFACLVLALLATPALAEVAMPPQVPASVFPMTVSYTVNAPLQDTSPEAIASADRDFRRAMYARAASECEDLLATIAASCSLTGISVSSQVNNYPGQPVAIYVSTSVTMQITLK